MVPQDSVWLDEATTSQNPYGNLVHSGWLAIGESCALWLVSDLSCVTWVTYIGGYHPAHLTEPSLMTQVDPFKRGLFLTWA